MKVLVLLVCAFSPALAISKPANDSTKYSKSLVWVPDRAQKVPAWTHSDIDFNFKFRYLENLTSGAAHAKQAITPSHPFEEKISDKSDANDSDTDQ